jgi:PPOX class probable F420-dependent enzyme
MPESLILPDPVREFLSAPRFGVLATIAEDGIPHQTVLWYEVRDDHILMNTARGRAKDRHVRRDPRVSLCVEDGYRFVALVGTLELDDDQHVAQADIAHLAYHYQGRESAERNIARFRRQHRVTMRLRVDHVIAEGFES